MSDTKDDEYFKNKYIRFMEYVDSIIIKNEIIKYEIKDIENAVNTFRKEIFQKDITENNELKERKLKHINLSENDTLDEYNILNSYVEKIEVEKKREKEKNAISYIFAVIIAVANAKRRKKTESDICYIMSTIQEKLTPFKSKILYDITIKKII